MYPPIRFSNSERNNSSKLLLGQRRFSSRIRKFIRGSPSKNKRWRILEVKTRTILLFQRKTLLQLEAIRGPENPVGKLSSKTRDIPSPCQKMEIPGEKRKKEVNQSNSYRRGNTRNTRIVGIAQYKDILERRRRIILFRISPGRILIVSTTVFLSGCNGSRNGNRV